MVSRYDGGSDITDKDGDSNIRTLSVVSRYDGESDMSDMGEDSES